MIDIIFVQTDTSHPVGFECDMDREHDWWLFVQTHIQTYFVIDGKRIVMPAHAAILYPPHSLIQYGAAEKKIYSDGWKRRFRRETTCLSNSFSICWRAKIFSTINTKSRPSRLCFNYCFRNCTNRCPATRTISGNWNYYNYT